MNEFNTDMMLTLACTKSSSSSRLFHIFNLPFIHTFFHSFIWIRQLGPIGTENKNIKTCMRYWQNTSTEDQSVALNKKKQVFTRTFVLKQTHTTNW